MWHHSLIQSCVMLTLLALLVTGLAGCGKKPSTLDPPPGIAADNFPRTYPDPTTDPQP